MTRVYNDPADFADEALTGFSLLHARYVRQVPGGVVRRSPGPAGKVAVVFGGGSGHYPAFAGLVGPGFGDGAVVGNIFTSPSAQHAYSVAKRAHRGGGVVFSYGNYAGDVMNFGIAGEQLQAEGIDARQVVVTDDVLSAPADKRHQRRGIAGDFVVYRALAAAAERGLCLDDVVRVGEKANDATRTAGVAFSGCTFPGADEALFEVAPGTMAVGLGIHGESGLETVPRVPSRQLAEILVRHCLADRPAAAGARVAVVLNGLGATKHEELFVLWNDVVPLLAAEGLEVVDPEVGELVTSLEMAGVSLTLTWLDDELAGYWQTPADSPGYRKGSVAALAGEAGDLAGGDDTDPVEEPVPPASAESAERAGDLLALLEVGLAVVREAEGELAAVDAIAGDGDHGRGMVRGLEAAVSGARRVVEQGGGLGTALAAAGDLWGERAGGTSGVLWGSALRSSGALLGDEDGLTPDRLAQAVEAFTGTLTRLGKAQPGDKTMLDAAVPFTEAFRAAVRQGASSAEALAAATDAAVAGAAATSAMVPRIGRARPHAAKSLGHPDAGALSLSLLVRSTRASLEEYAR
jgi:dihydroxyacetone kinase